ncbi:unnamed protein product [Brassica oleracea var. botrytis]|uniref:Uncharacterized protein n=1 Tax=Brassica oleracea var. oleracea TaxID=109376 RepID=A0A0D3EGX5_BRAOL
MDKNKNNNVEQIYETHMHLQINWDTRNLRSGVHVRSMNLHRKSNIKRRKPSDDV